MRAHPRQLHSTRPADTLGATTHNRPLSREIQIHPSVLKKLSNFSQ
jgi:hypothetical protein